MEEFTGSKALSEMSTDDIRRFTESYASFSRIVNSLQRKYLQLKEDFSSQHEQLADTNRQLVELTRQNLKINSFLHSILNAMSAGVIAVDTSGRVTHCNPAASVLLGIPSDDLVGKMYRDCITPGDPIDANALRTAMSGETVINAEKTLTSADGTVLHLLVSTALLCDDDRKRVGAVEVFHDQTKTKRIEKELARLNTLAALGEMAATIAHEVRNPLTAISGFAAFLERDLPSDDPRQKMVAKITRGVESLNQTVTSLLNYTRFDEVSSDPIDLARFLQNSVQQYKYDDSNLARGTRFNVRSAYGGDVSPITISGDSMLLRQLFYNLFTNAIEAGDGETQIDITYARLPRQKACRLYGDRVMLGLDETLAEITVTDDGPGLTEEVRERLFAPFYTTKPDGNGLGLAMAWKIVKAHGGDIVAENASDGGTTFAVVLPIKLVATQVATTWDQE
jgi:PAS domain S-box-containing protein